MKNLLFLLLILFCHVLYAQNLKDSLGRKQGCWIEKIKRKKVESHYKDGLLHGRQTIFQKRKDVNLERYFKNGVLDSVSREYVISSNQIITEASFKDGLLHGYYYRVYWDNGKILIEVSFENGTPNTDFKFCSSDGLLMSKHILHPSKLFFFIQVGYHEDSVIFQCFTYQDPLYFIDDSSIIGRVKINSIFSEDVVKWMKSKKSFKERRKMAEKLYGFKVACK